MPAPDISDSKIEGDTENSKNYNIAGHTQVIVSVQFKLVYLIINIAYVKPVFIKIHSNISFVY